MATRGEARAGLTSAACARRGANGLRQRGQREAEGLDLLAQFRILLASSSAITEFRRPPSPGACSMRQG